MGWGASTTQGKESPQLTLAQISGLFRGQLVPEGSFYDGLRRFGEEVVREEDFASLYTPGIGRPSLPPVFMCKVLLLEYHDGVSDREAEERARYDLRWKWALNLWLDQAGFDHSSLSRFRSRLVVKGKERLAFEAFLRMAQDRGLVLPGGRSIVDSTAVLGAGAVVDTFQLIRHSIRKLRKRARRVAGLGAVLDGVLQRTDYMETKKAQIDWEDQGAREALLGEVVADARRAVEAVRNALGEDLAKATDVAEAVDLLDRVVGQDIQEDDGKVHLREGVAPDRVVSTTDPQMRHGHKTSSGKFNGSKAHVAIDEATELVTDVDVFAGNGADDTPVMGMVDRMEALQIKPAQLLGDHAYGHVEMHEQLAARQIEAVAPVAEGRGVRGLYGKDAFVIDLEKATCRCPAQQFGRPRYAKDGRLKAFVFGKSCSDCPLRVQCTTSADGRVVNLHEREADLQRLRAKQKGEAFGALYRLRPKVERVISHLKSHGARRSRYRSHKRRLVQLAFTAVVVNIEKWMALLKARDVAIA